MRTNHKITYAVLTALSAHGVASHAADADQATPGPTAAAAPDTGAIQEVTVTAQRRAESVQDVPITVQAITGETLAQLNIQSAEDLLKYTPNVTYSGNGPGTGNIFMRGMGGIGSGNQSQSTTAAFPNVALYLDDQSMQFPARNNDVYLIDMARVEVLEGPQGTLFGGGAQAGAIRYITNKPNLNQVSGEANAGYGATAHGDNNNLANLTLNVPLIPDVLGVRAVVFSEHRGGYIDNVPSTIRYLPGSPAAVDGGDPHANNGNQVADHTNPVSYGGARLSILWKLNENWNFLLQQNYQDMEADGYFYAYPFDSNGTALGPYQIAAFEPAYNKDRYESTAWTLNGNIGGFNAIYTGSYMVRHIEGQQDYSNYMRSVAGSNYGCIGTGAPYFNEKKFAALVGSTLQCYPPVGSWKDTVSNTHWSHELRVSSPADYRLRGIAGVYWEKFVINDNMNFNYLPIQQCDAENLDEALAGGPFCLSAVGPVPGAFAIEPGLRTGTNTAFGEDAQRGYKQLAFFLSLDFDIIPKVLTISGGGRFYHYDEFEHGSEYYTESTSPLLINHPNGACTAAGACGFPINLDKTETGSRWRGNLTWHITPDVMAYYTYSQGFRPGGFNRTKSLVGQPPVLKQEAPYASPADDTYQYLKPAGYDSDDLTNNEIGFKSEFFDHRLLFNVSGYIMNWSNIQLSLFDPVHLGNTTFNVNGPTYKIKGFEVQFVARVTEGLTIEGSSAVNSSEQTDAPCLKSAGVVAGNSHFTNNPTPAGACITQINGAPYTNPFGQLDTRPAFSPPWMFNIRARYDWEMGTGYRPFFWVGASHIAAMSNQPASFPDGNLPNTVGGCLTPGTTVPTTTLCKYEIPGYTTYDAAFGVAKDQWMAEIHSANLSNEYGPSNVSSGQFIRSEIPLRPRTIMFNISYKF